MTKKITFNCPSEFFQIIEQLVKTGSFNTYTDVILTALRDTYIKDDTYFEKLKAHKKILEEVLYE